MFSGGIHAGKPFSKKGMIMTGRVILFAVFSLLVAGCLAGEVEHDGNATHEVAVNALSDQGTQGVRTSQLEVGEQGLLGSSEATGAAGIQCEPGPPSNWCQNVDGTSCSSSTFRRCYLPNYCEWMICMCEGGSWNCQY